MRLLAVFLFFLAGFLPGLAIPNCVIIPGKNAGPKGTYADRSIAASHGHTLRTFVEARSVLSPSECILAAIRHRSINSANPPFYHNPTNAGFGTNNLFINHRSAAPTHANQCIKDLGLNGGRKKWKGGIDVESTTKISFPINCFNQNVYVTRSFENNSESKIGGKPLQDDASNFNINPRNNDLSGEVRIVQLFQKL